MLIQISVHSCMESSGKRFLLSINTPMMSDTIFPSNRLDGKSVSIHAPVRGATSFARSNSSGDKCFNPRARAGRDHLAALQFFPLTGFQSTRPCGARHNPLFFLFAPLLVSIHAPVRGATFRFCNLTGYYLVSIHAPPLTLLFLL